MAEQPRHHPVPPQWNRHGFTPQGPLTGPGGGAGRSAWFLPALIFSVAATMAFLFVASGILVAWIKQGEVADPSVDPEPTRTAPASPSPEATWSPEPEPTTSSSPKQRKKKQKPPHLRKQKGYEAVPLPPAPDSAKEAAAFIKKNKVYSQRAATKTCSGLPDETGFPYGNVSNKTWRRVAQKMADCARNAWAKPLARAGYQATKAKVTLYSGSVDTPCGDQVKASGVYCSANQVIYLNKDGGGGGHPSEYHWTWYLMTMAHEYGHHVQARTGILDASWRWQQSQGDEDDYWRVNRRLELQANCLGGMALRRTSAVSSSSFETYASRLYGEKVHGSTKNQYTWYRKGWNETKIARCNTYRAKGGQVS